MKIFRCYPKKILRTIMTSFAWKRKLNKDVTENKSKVFQENEQVEEDDIDPDFD